jgi:hypothetical protein
MNFSDWQKDMLRLAVIYHMLEHGQQFSTIPGDNSELGFLDPTLDKMCVDGYLDATNEGWYVATPKGSQVLERAVKALAAMEPFEVLGGFKLEEQLLEDEQVEGDDYQIKDELYDPRFAPPDDSLTDEHVDLRLPILSFLSEYQKEQAVKVDPHRVVFIRQLANGVFDNKDFWFNLRAGEYFRDVEEIVENAYRWTDLAEDVEDAKWYMEQIYKAAMTENIKRGGDECSNCRTPLGMFEYVASRENIKLDECPNCNHSFNPPESEGGDEIVETVTTTTEEVIEEDESDDGFGCGGYYCEPPYYYDPYYMWGTDVLATAIILDAVF